MVSFYRDDVTCFAGRKIKRFVVLCQEIVGGPRINSLDLNCNLHTRPHTASF